LSYLGSNYALFVARLTGLVTATGGALLVKVFTAAGWVLLTWPNPAAAQRTLQFVDNLSREVLRQQLLALTSSATLDVASLAPGLYMLPCSATSAS
jgi:hypothetical protein